LLDQVSQRAGTSRPPTHIQDISCYLFVATGALVTLLNYCHLEQAVGWAGSIAHRTSAVVAKVGRMRSHTRVPLFVRALSKLEVICA
jgi:hypothetical protein